MGLGHLTNTTTTNFRIDDSWIIKVADFGLSKNTGAKDYIRQDETSGAKLLPVKWMAMESLEQGVFSEKTDVVSSWIVKDLVEHYNYYGNDLRKNATPHYT